MRYFQVPNNRRAHIIDSMQEYGLIANRLDPNKSFDAIFWNYHKRCDANLNDVMEISSIIPIRCDDNIKEEVFSLFWGLPFYIQVFFTTIGHFYEYVLNGF